MGLVGFLPGLGGGIAAAGVWVGILRMVSKNKNVPLFELAQDNIGELLFIALLGPVVAIAAIVVMFIQVGGPDDDGQL